MLKKLYDKYMDVSFYIFFMFGWVAEYVIEPMYVGFITFIGAVFVLIPLTVITAKFPFLIIIGLVSIWLLILGWFVKFLFEKLK